MAASGGSPGAGTTRVIIPRIDRSDCAETPTITRSRVLTGYRPTGPLHVGHWAGNIENMLTLQDDPTRECFFFIADWHMLTTHYDRTDELPGFVHELMLDWFAAGIDPDRATIYRQSDLPEVAESPDRVEEIEGACRSGALGCVDCKTALADQVIERFGPYRERRATLAQEAGLVERVLAEGQERVRPLARATLAAVRRAMHAT